MKDRLTTYERRESIRLLLVKERSTTTQKLVEMFGVTKQTILNEIVFLSSMMPLVTQSGNGGGIFLNMEYESPKEYLNAEELMLLMSLLDTLNHRDKLLLINIINKFSLPKDK